MVQDEEAGYGNGNRRSVIDIDRADEVSLLAFESEVTVAAEGTQGPKLFEYSFAPAPGTAQAQAAQ
jgi:hypothetical protein